jgi:flavorubredoxin
MSAPSALRLAPDAHRDAVEIASGVHWIGVLDPDLRRFDLVLHTANGTSYNAYVVRGEHGVAVIDTVKESFSAAFFAKFEQVARYEEITAVVLNHLEPDHTGALPELLRRAPQARVVISRKAPLMLKALLKPLPSPAEGYCIDASGEPVDLGGRTLEMIPAPYLHWPETQFTWLKEDGILFSGDVFGCHFCDARLFNDACGDFRFSFEYYYAHLMRPFRGYVMDALARIEALPLTQIAPAHGPVLRHAPRHYVNRYRSLSTPRLPDEAGDEKTLLIFYLSAYGNTRRMAEAIRDGVDAAGGIRVSLFDIEGSVSGSFADLIEEADGIVLGSPTLNGDAVKPIWELLSSLTAIGVQGKVGAAFGSYGWSGEAVRMMDERLNGLKFDVPVTGLRVKLVPTDDELAGCRDFGAKLADYLNLSPAQRASA